MMPKTQTNPIILRDCLPKVLFFCFIVAIPLIPAGLCGYIALTHSLSGNPLTLQKDGGTYYIYEGNPVLLDWASRFGPELAVLFHSVSYMFLFYAVFLVQPILLGLASANLKKIGDLVVVLGLSAWNFDNSWTDIGWLPASYQNPMWIAFAICFLAWAFLVYRYARQVNWDMLFKGVKRNG